MSGSAPTVTTCPSWCRDCFLDDLDGSTYHRGADVEIGRGATVRSFAWQPAGGEVEAPTFTLVTGGDDVDYTADELRQLGRMLAIAAGNL